MAKKGRTRQQYKRKNDKAGRAGQKTPLWVWGLGGGLVAVLLVAGLLYLGYSDSATAQADIDGLVIFPAPSRDHLDGDVAYAQDVPPGGPHNPTWLNCGIYDEPVRAENAVHSLEHGAVWLTYLPDLPAAQVDLLRDLVRGEQSRLRERLIILSPRPDLDDPIVATAWQAQLRLDDASDERLVEFVQRFQKGPYTPEPGADCTFGGDGHPSS
jgi:hypothetical protein